MNNEFDTPEIDTEGGFSEPGDPVVWDTSSPVSDEHSPAPAFGNSSFSSERVAQMLIDVGNAIGRVVAPIAFAIMIGVVVAYAWNQVEVLFGGPLRQTGVIVGIPVSHFAAATSVGMALVMLVIGKYATHTAVRAGATIWAVVYVALTFVLVFISWALGAGNGQAEGLMAVVTDATSILPFLPLLGSAGVVVLASMGLMCFGVLIGTSKNHSARFESENRARGHLIGNFAKVVVTLASVGFSIWFGVTVLGVNPALAAMLGLVLDIGLINSWSKSESAAEADDMPDAHRWRSWAYVFGFAVALMAVESVGTQFKTSAAHGNQAVSPQLTALLNSDVFGLMQAIGAVAIICAIGLSIVQLLLTMRPVVRPMDAFGDMVTVQQPIATRIANSIRAARAGWSEITDALNDGRQPAQLPSPVMAQDTPGGIVESPLYSPDLSPAQRQSFQTELARREPEPTQPAQPEMIRGRDYDATAEVIMSPDASGDVAPVADEHNNERPRVVPRRPRRTTAEVDADTPKQ
jgi:hypothetical protein